VPLADWLERILRWRHDPVDRAGKLRVFEALVVFLVPFIVKELDFHAGLERRVAVHGAAQGDAAVALFGQLEFQAKLKIAVLLVGHQPPAPAAVDIQDAGSGAPNLGISLPLLVDLPAAKILAIEERLKAFRRLVLGSNGRA